MIDRRIRAVIRKEFREYRHNRLILITAVLVPVLFLVIPTVAIVLLPDQAPPEAVTTVVGQAMLFFLIVPVMVPTTIAAYTVIGEREQATLEPTLTTPVTDSELLMGKAIAATVPAVVMAWLLFGVFLGLVAAFGSEAVRAEALQPGWLMAQVLLAPVTGVVSIEVGMAVSARSTDIRVAQQLSGLMMIPVVGGVAALSLGVVDPTPDVLVGGAAVLAVLSVYGWRLLLRLFDRERLLTRWG